MIRPGAAHLLAVSQPRAIVIFIYRIYYRYSYRFWRNDAPGLSRLVAHVSVRTYVRTCTYVCRRVFARARARASSFFKSPGSCAANVGVSPPGTLQCQLRDTTALIPARRERESPLSDLFLLMCVSFSLARRASRVPLCQPRRRPVVSFSSSFSRLSRPRLRLPSARSLKLPRDYVARNGIARK